MNVRLSMIVRLFQAVLGAILLTGFLGGAVAAQMRIEAPLAGFTFFPIYVATFIWAGLYLRQPKLATVFPFVADAA